MRKPGENSFPGGRFGLRYEQAFWQRRLKLFHNSDVLPVNVDYDAVPAAGKDTTDTALIFKLDYAL